MAISEASVQYNDGFLPDMILLTLSMFLPSSGNITRLNARRVFVLQPMILPKRFDMYCSECLDAFRLFFIHTVTQTCPVTGFTSSIRFK